MQAMILTAGYGHRCLPLTKSVPKPLLSLYNIPTLEWIIVLLKEAGVTSVICNLHHLADKMIQHFKEYETRHRSWGIQVQWTHESEEILGTGGGIKLAQPLLTESSFWVVNCDVLFHLPLKEMWQWHQARSPHVTLGVIPFTSVYYRYTPIHLNHQKEVVSFNPSKNPSNSKSPLNIEEYDPSTFYHFTGIQIVSSKSWQYFPQTSFYGTTNLVYPSIIQSGNIILGYELEGDWYDLGELEKYYIMEQWMSKEIQQNPSGYWGNLYHTYFT